MRKARYYISNGFHNTETYILAEPRVGARASERVMEAAKRRLCPSRHNGCACIGSPAGAALPHQPHGFAEHPDLFLESDFPGGQIVDNHRHSIFDGCM